MKIRVKSFYVEVGRISTDMFYVKWSKGRLRNYDLGPKVFKIKYGGDYMDMQLAVF